MSQAHPKFIKDDFASHVHGAALRGGRLSLASHHNIDGIGIRDSGGSVALGLQVNEITRVTEVGGDQVGVLPVVQHAPNRDRLGGKHTVGINHSKQAARF